MAAENAALAALAALNGAEGDLEFVLEKRVTELRAVMANYRKGLAKVVDVGMSAATFQNTYQNPLDEATGELITFATNLNGDLNYYGGKVGSAL